MSIEHSPATQKKRAKPTLAEVLQLRSWTIGQWCEIRGYSRPFFYTLKKTGDAPDVIGEGKGQRITDQADARWLKRQEAKARARLRSG